MPEIEVTIKPVANGLIVSGGETIKVFEFASGKTSAMRGVLEEVVRSLQGASGKLSVNITVKDPERKCEVSSSVPEKRWLTPNDVVAEYGGITVKTLQKWRDESKGPAWSKIGGKILYSRTDLEDCHRLNRVQTVDYDEN